MRKNISNCPKCGTPMLEYRMVVMIGPKGWRGYGVCLACAKKMGLREPKRGADKQRGRRQVHNGN